MTQQDLGTCWGTPNGLSLSMPSYMATGKQVVVEAVLRRWTTTRKQLIYDLNYGYNVYDLISDDLGPNDIARAQQQMAAEAQKDERVTTCTVSIVLTVAGLLTIIATIGIVNGGTLRLVLAVSAVTIQVLIND